MKPKKEKKEIKEDELTDMFGEGGKEEVKEFYNPPTPKNLITNEIEEIVKRWAEEEFAYEELIEELTRLAEKVVGEMVVEEKEVGNQAYSRLKKIYGIRGWNELLKRIGYNQSCQDQIKKAKEMGIKI